MSGATMTIQQRMTEAVRAADKTFEAVGGSSRHYVNECLVSALLDVGLVVVDRKDLDATLAEQKAALDAERAKVARLRDVLEQAEEDLADVHGRDDPPSLASVRLALRDLAPVLP